MVWGEEKSSGGGGGAGGVGRMPAPFEKCSPIFCLSTRASVRELRRVQVWPTGLMQCGVSPGESRSSLKLPSPACLCCSVTLHNPSPSIHAIIFSTRPYLHYNYFFYLNSIYIDINEIYIFLF